MIRGTHPHIDTRTKVKGKDKAGKKVFRKAVTDGGCKAWRKTHEVVGSSQLNDSLVPVRFLSERFVDLIIQIADLKLSQARILDLSDLHVKESDLFEIAS